MKHQDISSSNKDTRNYTTGKYFNTIKNNNDILQDITLSIDVPSSNKETKHFEDFSTSNIIKSQIYQEEESKSYIKELLEICNCVKKQKKYNTIYRGLNTGDLLEITKRRKRFFIKKDNKNFKIKRIHTADEKNLIKKNENDKRNKNNSSKINNIKKFIETKIESKLWTNINNNKTKSMFKSVNNYKNFEKTEYLTNNFSKNKKNNSKKKICNKSKKFNTLLYNSSKLNNKSSKKFITQLSNKDIKNKTQFQIKYIKNVLFNSKKDINSNNNSNNKIEFFQEINKKFKKPTIFIKNEFEEQNILTKTINVSKKEYKKKLNTNNFLQKNLGSIKKKSTKKSDKWSPDSDRVKNPNNLNNNNDYSLSSRKITQADNNDSNFENILCTKESLNANTNNNKKAHIIDIKFFKRKKSLNNYTNCFRKNIFDLSEEKINSTSINPQIRTKKSRIVNIYIDSKFLLLNKI